MTLITRGRQSVIDFFLANQKASADFTDVCVFRRADIGSDYFLFQAKINMNTRWSKKLSKMMKTQNNGKKHLLCDPSINYYQETNI